MMLRRSAVALARQARSGVSMTSRTFSTSVVRRDATPSTPATTGDNSKIKTFNEVKTDADLRPAGAPVGSVPTELNQSTGLERLEILGKMEGIDIFDMRPLDASRKGTIDNPIVVQSYGEEQYCGCTGFPADSHEVNWLTISKDRPIERCSECGNVLKMDYIGPTDSGHDHDHDHGAYHEPKTIADFVKPEYYYR